MKKKIFRTINTGIVLAMISCLFLVNCAITDHTVVVLPPNVDRPVSASSYLEDKGKIITPKNVTIVEHFSFEKKVEGAVAAETKSELDLSDDLNKIMNKAAADGIINLTVAVANYDPGTTYSTGFFRIFGSMMSLFGGIFLIAGVAGEMDEMLYMGAGFGGAGLLSLLFSFITPSMGKSVWTIYFEGDAVKRK